MASSFPWTPPQGCPTLLYAKFYKNIAVFDVSEVTDLEFRFYAGIFSQGLVGGSGRLPISGDRFRCQNSKAEKYAKFYEVPRKK